MIPIKPMYIKGLSCYEGSLVAIAASLQKEYKLAYMNTFGFSYIQDSACLIGDKIIVNNEFFYENLRKFSGVNMYTLKIKTDMITAVNEMIDKGIPVGVETDAFYCPWSFEYQKGSYGHNYLIIGRNVDGYQCIDTTMYEKIYSIDYKNFLLGTSQLVGFTYEDSCRKYDYFDLFLKSIDNNKVANCMKALEIFRSDFSNIDYDKEFESFADSHWGCSLQRNIGYYIIGSVELYLEFIEYLYNKLPYVNFLLLIENLKALKDEWYSLYGIILKIYYTKDPEKYKAKPLMIINKIIDKYTMIFDFAQRITRN